MYYSSGLPAQVAVHLVISVNAGRNRLVPSHSCNASTGTESPEFEITQILHRFCAGGMFCVYSQQGSEGL